MRTNQPGAVMDQPLFRRAADCHVSRISPTDMHAHAHEMFYVLSGCGRAYCSGKTYDVEKGDTLVLPPGMEHVVENTGSDKLYCLTVMVPNEGFAELIRNGEIMSLDDSDRRVVAR